MERVMMLYSYWLAVATSFGNLVLVLSSESPSYTVVHSESDFEVRLYRESSWMSAPVQGSSFEKSTKEGFHRLYQYIQGDNLNSSQLVMTAPVLTSITPSLHAASYTIRYYLPAIYENIPPQPSPELNLQSTKWKTHCLAVRKFSGFAKDDNIDKEIEALLSSLNKHSADKTPVIGDEKSYSIAQYNASHHPSGRLNEVWMNVSGFVAEGCPLYQE